MCFKAGITATIHIHKLKFQEKSDLHHKYIRESTVTVIPLLMSGSFEWNYIIYFLLYVLVKLMACLSFLRIFGELQRPLPVVTNGPPDGLSSLGETPSSTSSASVFISIFYKDINGVVRWKTKIDLYWLPHTWIISLSSWCCCSSVPLMSLSFFRCFSSSSVR